MKECQDGSNITKVDKHRHATIGDDIPLEFLSGRLTSGSSVGDFGKSFVSLTDRCTSLHSDR